MCTSGTLRAVSAVPQQESRRKRRRVSGPAIDQLSFLDLLYAVPVGDLATRVSTATPAQVSSADWSALAVIMATIVFSWIGLHKDRAARLDGAIGAALSGIPSSGAWSSSSS